MFVVGGCSYAVYSMCVYFSAQHVWLSPVGGFVLGIGAALFWTAQGALIMAYSTSESRGRLIGIFWAIFNLGGVLGGLMEAALNWTSGKGGAGKGGANPLSYFVMTGIMLLGPVLTVLLLAKPENVIRADGSPVVLTAAGAPQEELRAAVAALRYPFVLLSLPFFFFSNWFYTYDFDGFNSTQFNVRTRGLNSALFWLAQMVAASVLGDRLDSKGPLKRRALLGLVAVVASLLVSLGPAIWINFNIECDGQTGWDKGDTCEMDVVTDFPTSLFPVLVFILLGTADAMFQTYAYWLMSSAAGTSVRHAVMYSAIYKSAQSCGGGVAWLLDLVGRFTYKDQGIVALSLCCASCIPILWTFSKLPEEEDKTPLTQGQEDVSMQ